MEFIIIAFFAFLFVVFVGGAAALTIYAVASAANSSVRAKKYGVLVLAKVKSINRRKDKNRRGNVTSDNTEIICEFDYNGSHEMKLRYNYKLNLEKLKVGDVLECIYEPKKKFLTTKDNAKTYKWVVIAFAVIVLMFVFAPTITKNMEIKNIPLFGKMVSLEDISIIIFFIVWEFLAIRLFDVQYFNRKYVRLTGKVIDIHEDVTGAESQSYVYIPEAEFEYNGKKMTRLVGMWSSGNRNIKKGSEIDVYYNPETDATYARGNNFYAIFFTLLGLLALIPIVKMFK